MSASAHVAVYGNAKLLRAACRACGDVAFVIDGRSACCDEPNTERPTRVKRIICPEQERRRPPKAEQQAILAAQENRCLYCEREFGLRVDYGRRSVVLTVAWDHLVPFAYGQDNHVTNFAAACQLCNGIKSDHLFQSIDEARLFVRMRLDAKNQGIP